MRYNVPNPKTKSVINTGAIKRKSNSFNKIRKVNASGTNKTLLKTVATANE